MATNKRTKHKNSTSSKAVEIAPLSDETWTAMMEDKQQLANETLNELLKNEDPESIVLERALPHLNTLNIFLKNPITLKDIDSVDLSTPEKFFGLLNKTEQDLYLEFEEIPKKNYFSNALENFCMIKEITQRCPKEIQNLSDRLAQVENEGPSRTKIVTQPNRPRDTYHEEEEEEVRKARDTKHTNQESGHHRKPR